MKITLTIPDLLIVVALCLTTVLIAEAYFSRRASNSVIAESITDPLLEQTVEKVAAGELTMTEAQAVIVADVAARAQAGKHRR